MKIHTRLNKIKKYGITNKELAKLLGYLSDQSFCNSPNKNRIISAFNEVINRVENKIIKDLQR